jgi:DNA-binding protein HU-beta
MAAKNPLAKPLNKLKDTAVGAISDPKGTADKVVEQAKGAASVGRMVAEGVVGEVASRARRRRASDAPKAEPTPAQPATAPPTKKQGDPVAPAEEPARSPGEPQVDEEAAAAAQKVTPADVAKKAAKKAPAKKTAKKTAKKPAAKQAPAKKAPAKKGGQGSPGDKLPPRKRTASAAEVADGGPGVETPVGTTGAAPARNPDTAESDLQQPGTEEIVERGTAKKIAKEAERGRRAAEGNAG